MAPRCYVFGTVRGFFQRATLRVPARVGYDEVYERVVLAGLSVEEVTTC